MSEVEVNYAKVVSDCAKNSQQALENVEKFLSSLREADKDREGIGLLEVKNREMLSYIMEMTFLMERMSSGQSVVGSSAFTRAALHRTVLERIKPIEQKISSQVDKLTQKQTNNIKQEGALKPRLDQMEFDNDESEDDDEEKEDEEDEKAKKYVPPKMMAVHYEDEDNRAKFVEKSRRRALQSSLIQELKQQYSDAPEEYREVSEKKWKMDKLREEFEEDNLMRIKMTKADRARERKFTSDNAVDDLLNFGNYMMRGEDGEALGGKRKRSGGGPGGKKPRMNKNQKLKVKKAKKAAKQKAIKRRT